MPLAVHARTAPPLTPPALRRPAPPEVSPRISDVDPKTADLEDRVSVRDRADLLVLMRTLGREDAEKVDAELAEAEVELETDAVVASEAEVAVRVDFEIEVTVAEARAEAPEGEAKRQDPLVLDLDGDGQISLTGVADGLDFDLDADGRTDRAATVAGGDAFLALDRDGDGRITSGAELFGDATGARDGFADLARLDDNGDGVFDARDTAFDDVVVFDGHRTRSLAEAGVASIDLRARAAHRERADGNAEVAQSTFRRTDGTLGRVADVLLAYRSVA